jgi:hypothetical protein
MKEDFAKWKHDEELTATGPRNRSIWQDDDHGDVHQDVAGRSRPTVRHETGLSHDRHPALQYPEDAHNPLGVLAEASVSAGNAAINGHTGPSPFQPTGGLGNKPGSNDGEAEDETFRGYFVPLDKVLKKDAPHIMSLISIPE